MIEIIPAVMPKHYDDLLEKINRVDDLVKWVQIDVMDGVFVKSKSWPYVGDPKGHFALMKDQDEGLPSWDKLDFSIDMMVSNVEEKALEWIEVGASRLIFHIESMKEPAEEYFKNLKDQYGVEICLALAPSTPNSAIMPFLDVIDSVQFMGIEKVGFQGEPFVEEVYEKMSALRALTTLPISIDGGVNFDTAPKLVEAGATRLVSGSVLFNSPSIIDALEDFEDLF